MTTTLLNNRYQVIQVLGAGGFGETFLAEDTHMPSRRHCVIKQLKPVTNNDPQAYRLIQQRFEREAATLEYLGEGSDQIPKLYAYFSENGQFYLVQEWIQGQTLTEMIKTQGLQSETAVTEILLRLLSVLDYVHSKGIIHRDIKPDNIILRSSNNKPVLIDFGAVKETIRSVVNSPGYPTRSLVIGTPGFMPSEQAIGRPVYSTDIYSLGMTAVYLLTGKYPHEIPTHPQSGEVLWHQYAPGVSPGLMAVLDQAMKPHASDRYTTASKMLFALQSVMVNPSTQTSSSGVITQPTVALSPAAGAAFHPHTQPPSTPQNRPVGIPKPSTSGSWRWALIAGGILLGGLTSAIAISNTLRQPEPETPFTTSPTEVPTEPQPETNTPSPEPTREPILRNLRRNNRRAVPSPPPPLEQNIPVPSDTSTPDPSPEVPLPSDTSTPDAPSEVPSPSPEAEIPQPEPTPTETPQQSPPPTDPSPSPEPSLTVTPTPVEPTPPPQETQEPAPSQTTSRRVPTFSTGSAENVVRRKLGQPTRVSNGLWNTRAYYYRWEPNRVDLGYLFDRNTGVLRQTEVSFDPSTQPEEIKATLQGMLGGRASGNIKRGLQKVYERQANEYSFSAGGLEGVIQRNSKDKIYIGVWDADLK